MKKKQVYKTSIGAIKAEQLHSDVVIGETLESVSANGLMIAEAFRLYMEAMNWGEGDRFFRKSEDGEIEEYD